MKGISKEWDWNKANDKIWFTYSEESYYLISRWKEKGFCNFLDLGCGMGRHSIQFAKEGFNVKAIDLSKIGINKLKKWAKTESLNIETKVCNMMKLPFKDKSIDCIFSFNVIYHTDNNGIKRVISEMKRVLKDGGEFFVTLASKNAWSFKKSGFPRIDDNTILKIEDGPENKVPHFFVDYESIKELFSEFHIESVRQMEVLISEGNEYSTWHYFVLGRKLCS